MSKVTTPEQLATQQQAEQLRAIAHLAGLLQHLESTVKPVHPDQYRTVVDNLSRRLQDIEGSAKLSALLRNHPVAAELYENQQYANAGLCLQDLDRAIITEKMARDALEAIRAL